MRYDVEDWAPPNMPSMIANVGVLQCDTFPGLHSYYRDKQDHTEGLGAVPRGDPRYQGEVFTASGTGWADIETWSPNVVTVSVRGARPGDTLVMNQNWDPGWRANGRAALDYTDRVATTIRSADEVVTFRFIPRYFGLGCLVLVLAVAGLVWMSRVRRTVL